VSRFCHEQSFKLPVRTKEIVLKLGIVTVSESLYHATISSSRAINNLILPEIGKAQPDSGPSSKVAGMLGDSSCGDDVVITSLLRFVLANVQETGQSKSCMHLHGSSIST
jgi:hypothetical protein